MSGATEFATRADIELAIVIAVAGLATKADLVAKNVEITGLGNQVLTLTAGMRDLQQRFTAIELRLGALETRFGALETRFGALEGRFAVQEALLVRLAERIEGTPSGGAG